VLGRRRASGKRLVVIGIAATARETEPDERGNKRPAAHDRMVPAKRTPHPTSRPRITLGLVKTPLAAAAEGAHVAEADLM
jgi:hypothetical protein